MWFANRLELFIDPINISKLSSFLSKLNIQIKWFLVPNNLSNSAIAYSLKVVLAEIRFILRSKEWFRSWFQKAVQLLEDLFGFIDIDNEVLVTTFVTMLVTMSNQHWWWLINKMKSQCSRFAHLNSSLNYLWNMNYIIYIIYSWSTS